MVSHSCADGANFLRCAIMSAGEGLGLAMFYLPSNARFFRSKFVFSSVALHLLCYGTRFTFV